MLSVFLVVQFFLSQEVTGKDKALQQLNAKLAELNDLLSLEKLGEINLEDQLSQVRAGLAAAEGGSVGPWRAREPLRRAERANSTRRSIPKSRSRRARWRSSRY